MAFYLITGKYGEQKTISDATRFETLEDAKAAMNDDEVALIVETETLEESISYSYALCHFYTLKRKWFRFDELDESWQFYVAISRDVWTAGDMDLAEKSET